MNEPLAPAWLTQGLLFATSTVRQTYLLGRVRARSWGALPPKRGATMVIANHQHEDESEFIIERLYVADRWRRPIYTASSRRMYEPGFFAQRLPVVGAPARRLNAGRFFIAMGMLPIENQLAARPLASLARLVRQMHGDRAMREVFDGALCDALPGRPERLDDLFAAAFGAAAATVVKVSALREPYRSEALAHTRAQLGGDIARIRSVVAAGGTFFVTAEGDYSADGRLRRLRGIVKEIEPLADVWLCAIAYDVFRGSRLSMLYRLIRPAAPGDLALSLAAARPVTASALLARWVEERGGAAYDDDDAVGGVTAACRALPRTLFADPELLNDPATATREALRGLVRAHPRFPAVPDMIAFQAAFARETIAAAERIEAGA